MTVRIVSLGLGVQSTALSILNAQGVVQPPATDLVMADTGCEKPETLAYLDVFRPWAEAHGLRVHVISRRPDGLYGECWQYRMVPSPMIRWCTVRFKIAPIGAWLRAHGARPLDPADVQIGISADESHRAVDRGPRRYVKRRWPLVEMRLTRQDCRRVIAEAGLPEPVKSGCYLCPFHGRPEWLRLAQQHPDLWDKAVALEARAMERNPRDMLGVDRSLPSLIAHGRQLAWDELLSNDAGCVTGSCFV